MRRLHFRAPVILSALMLLGASALGAQATQAVTRSEMEAFVFAMIGTAAAVVFGSFWVLMNALVGRVERSLSASVTRLEGAVATATAALATHDESPHAHPVGSAARLLPLTSSIDALDVKVDALTEKLDKLIWDHDRIQATEGEVCNALRELRHRDPKDSPHPRRGSDPSEFDGTRLRGRG